MSDNVYNAPNARLIKEVSIEDPLYYVVASRKFWILFLATFTTYQIYWFYKHWSNYRLQTHEALWPVPRAIFSIFFTHSLFQKMENKLHADGSTNDWSPMGMATLFVVLTLTNNICSSLSDAEIGLPYTFIIYILAIPLVGWPLFTAQKAANQACDDPDGHSNSRITTANIAWLLLFGVLWVLIIAGVWLIFTDPTVTAT